MRVSGIITAVVGVVSMISHLKAKCSYPKGPVKPSSNSKNIDINNRNSGNDGLSLCL